VDSGQIAVDGRRGQEQPQLQTVKRTRQKVRDDTFNIFRRGRLEDKKTAPDDVEDRIGALQEVGNVCREACLQVLQNTSYDVNRACCLLLPESQPAKCGQGMPLSEFVRVEAEAITSLCSMTSLGRSEVIQLHYLQDGDAILTRKCLETCW
jgi:hypothetical protein